MADLALEVIVPNMDRLVIQNDGRKQSIRLAVKVRVGQHQTLNARLVIPAPAGLREPLGKLLLTQKGY